MALDSYTKRQILKQDATFRTQVRVATVVESFRVLKRALTSEATDDGKKELRVQQEWIIRNVFSSIDKLSATVSLIIEVAAAEVDTADVTDTNGSFSVADNDVLVEVRRAIREIAGTEFNVPTTTLPV